MYTYLLSRAFEHHLLEDRKCKKLRTLNTYHSQDVQTRFLPHSAKVADIRYGIYNVSTKRSLHNRRILSDALVKHVCSHFEDNAKKVLQSMDKYHRSPFDPGVFDSMIKDQSDFRGVPFTHLPSKKRRRLLAIGQFIEDTIFSDLQGKRLHKLTSGNVLYTSEFQTNSAVDGFYRDLGFKLKESFVPQLARERARVDAQDPMTLWLPPLRDPKCRRRAKGLYLRTKADAIHHFYSLIKERNRRFDEIILPPSTVALRHQVCAKEKVKCRPITVAPLDLLVEEAAYVLPFIRAVKSRPSSFFMFDCFIESAFPRFVQRHMHNGSTILGVDWSGFDKSVPLYIMQLGLAIFFSLFDNNLESSDGVFWPMDVVKQQKRLLNLVDYLINTPFRFPGVNRRFAVLSGGLPSGVGLTNILGSICNAIMILYLIQSQVDNYNSIFGLKVQGDDSITFLTAGTSIDLPVMAAYARKEFGMTMHPDKCSYLHTPFGTDVASDASVSILGHDVSLTYVSREPGKNLISALYPERNFSNPYEVSRRLVSLAWTIHRLDKYFEEMVLTILCAKDDYAKFHNVDADCGRSKYLRFISRMTLGPNTPLVDDLQTIRETKDELGLIGGTIVPLEWRGYHAINQIGDYAIR